MPYSTEVHYAPAAMDAANEYTTMYDCSEFQYCRITYITASSANATVKVQGSGQLAQPSLANAFSATNQFFPVGFSYSDLPLTAVDGDTGTARAGTDANYALIVDCRSIKRLGVLMTARSAGSVTAYFDFFNKN